MYEERTYYVYILASSKNGTLYIGVTNDLQRRLLEHKGFLSTDCAKKSFTQKYSINQLVYFEEFTEIGEAIFREKCLKKWKRSWKLALIERGNPNWKDLYFELFDEIPKDIESWY